ncbi:hypothetical protein [Salinirubrum litoreum]|uniref:Uncharacterized protein n=1 Tax=Salinirubrum litoreum TaxID=1126234 RepID=A0ABD5R984_9EURY|nr:hypothetical protein [Salinirubrum litoreum]
MPSSQQTDASTASWVPRLRDGRLLAVAWLCAVLELGLRALLSWLVSPVLFVVTPPVVAVAGLAVLARSRSNTDEPDTLPRLLASVAGLTVGGHAVALLVGSGLFLLVDTPIRVGLYALDYGDLLTPVVVALSPLVGVGIGTVLAWVVPARAVLARLGGRSGVESCRTALRTLLTDPRGVGRLAGVHLLGVVGLVGAVVAGGWLGSLVESRNALPVFLGVAVAGVLAVTALFVGLAVAHRTGRDVPASSPVPAGRLRVVGVVLLLVVAAVAGAGAVRVTDTRPTDTAAAPLPDDPQGAYHTALVNTERADHRYRVAVDPDSDEPFVFVRWIDRTDRQYRAEPRRRATGTPMYADSGTESPPLRGFDLFSLGGRTVGPDDRTVRASPGYARWSAEYSLLSDGGFSPPSPDATGWQVTARTDETLVLELTDPTAVLDAAYARDSPPVTNVTESRITVRIDRERRVVERAEYRFAGEIVDETDDETLSFDAHVVHEFETGIDVERPPAVGARSAGEWLWTLFAY